VTIAVSLILLATPIALGLMRTREAVEQEPARPPPAEAVPGDATWPEPVPADDTHTVAEAVVPGVKVFDSPADEKPSRRLDNPTEVGAPLVFLVTVETGKWLKVLLPVRPNGSTGWIRSNQVKLLQHDYRIEVLLDRHRLRAYDGDEVILNTEIAVGTQDTPTPGGRYYIKELLKPPNPNSVYGTYAYGLSGFSNVLESFAGGEGVIGIHGTNDPSVIGTDVSAGCIRMTNQDIEKLVKVLPLGTPVEILE
jgi:lipoprotein-anchoring transpeptidase ErfK/SrfK